jgi:phosphocarrier protein HPr
MIEQTLEVHEEDGLHTRPANKFVKLVKDGESEVTIAKNGTVAPGKSLLKIMKLAVVKGDTVTLTCEGPDEKSVMSAIIDLLQPSGAAE